MPWKPEDSPRYTKKAESPQEQKAWARVANAVLQKDGSERKAIRIASAVVKRLKGGDGGS